MTSTIIADRACGSIQLPASPGCVSRPPLPPFPPLSPPPASSPSILRPASCTSTTQGPLTRSSSSLAALPFAAAQVLWSLEHRTHTCVPSHPRSRSTQLVSSLSTALPNLSFVVRTDTCVYIGATALLCSLTLGCNSTDRVQDAYRHSRPNSASHRRCCELHSRADRGTDPIGHRLST